MPTTNVIRGAGFLEFQGREAPVAYVVEFWRDKRVQGADGKVNGDFGNLNAALARSDVFLRLEDGRRAAVVLTDLSFAGGSRIAVNGPFE